MPDASQLFTLLILIILGSGALTVLSLFVGCLLNCRENKRKQRKS